MFDFLSCLIFVTLKFLFFYFAIGVFVTAMFVKAEYKLNNVMFDNKDIFKILSLWPVAVIILIFTILLYIAVFIIKKLANTGELEDKKEQ